MPVLSKGSVVDQLPINQIQINPDPKWASKHWKTLSQVYGKTPYFHKYAPLLKPCFDSPPALLSDFTINLITLIARALGLGDKQFVRSSTLNITGNRSSRLVKICKHFGAKTYLTGPSANAYLEEDLFREANIRIEYMEYQYDEYEQVSPPFNPYVSILDLMFMTGPDAPRHIWKKE